MTEGNDESASFSAAPSPIRARLAVKFDGLVPGLKKNSMPDE
jgi:hypothetical protein